VPATVTPAGMRMDTLAAGICMPAAAGTAEATTAVARVTAARAVSGPLMSVALGRAAQGQELMQRHTLILLHGQLQPTADPQAGTLLLLLLLPVLSLRTAAARRSEHGSRQIAGWKQSAPPPVPPVLVLRLAATSGALTAGAAASGQMSEAAIHQAHTAGRLASARAPPTSRLGCALLMLPSPRLHRAEELPRVETVLRMVGNMRRA